MLTFYNISLRNNTDFFMDKTQKNYRLNVGQLQAFPLAFFDIQYLMPADNVAAWGSVWFKEMLMSVFLLNV